MSGREGIEGGMWDPHERTEGMTEERRGFKEIFFVRRGSMGARSVMWTAVRFAEWRPRARL